MSIIYNPKLHKHIDTDIVDPEEELEMVKEQAKLNEYVFRSDVSGEIFIF